MFQYKRLQNTPLPFIHPCQICITPDQHFDTKMRTLSFSIFLLITLFSAAAAADSNGDDVCVYTMYVKTGSIIKAGTDSNISLTLGDPAGRSVWVSNLRSWGIMEPKHDYFERANLDIFSGRGPCIGAPICRLNLTSNGSGLHHGWYCDYIEVTFTGPNEECSQTTFHVDQWLATDVYPYQLTAALDECKLSVDGPAQGKGMSGRRLVVGNPKGSAAASA